MLLAHGAGLTGLLAAGVPVSLRGIGSALILLSLLAQWRQLLQRHPNSVTQLILHPQHVELITRSGHCRPALVQPGARITPWCIALNLRPLAPRWWGDRYPLLLLPDALTATDWRRLRIWLRQGGGRGSDRGDKQGI